MIKIINKNFNVTDIMFEHLCHPSPWQLEKNVILESIDNIKTMTFMFDVHASVYSPHWYIKRDEKKSVLLEIELFLMQHKI